MIEGNLKPFTVRAGQDLIGLAITIPPLVSQAAGQRMTLITFDGYNPASTALRCSYLVGSCMGPDWPESSCVWYDSVAPIRSGDYVRLTVPYDDGTVAHLIKQLECTRDGRWWGVCDDGVFNIGALVVPTWIEKVVARATETQPTLALDRSTYRPASPEERAHYARKAQCAIDEWSRAGKPRGVPFPGLEAALRASLCEQFDSHFRGIQQFPASLTAHAALPQTNATSPSDPVSLGATQNVNGTLTFDIGHSVVEPPGTEYQIIRSTNSADASVGTVVWQGYATRVDLIAPNSAHWYYTRALVKAPKQHGGFTPLTGNYIFSHYFPNTFGLAAAPADVIFTAFINSLAVSNVA